MPLEDVSLEELHAVLDQVEEKKPTQRLLFAILYKQGPSVPMIADWFDMRAETIYRWFRRMETEPLAEAVQDAARPGRPPRLSSGDWTRFEQALAGPPKQVGYEESAWTPKLAETFLRDELDIDFSRRHVRRLLEMADSDATEDPIDGE